MSGVDLSVLKQTTNDETLILSSEYTQEQISPYFPKEDEEEKRERKNSSTPDPPHNIPGEIGNKIDL